MDQYYEEDSNPRLSEVEDILVDEAFVRPVVTKILDLERHREIELEIELSKNSL